MDVDDCISFPGASSLYIEFDAQCHTESGCDPLKFYAKVGRQEEVKNLSG